MKHAITLKRPRNSTTKALDPDNPPWRESMLGPPVVRRGRGPQRSPTKVATTLRLDRDVLEFFRSQGAGYQTRINEALRDVMDRMRKRPGRSRR
jgi:uncharacterized protein (DUF4415 family)